MKNNQVRGIALILFGILLEISNINADGFIGSADGLVWLIGIVIGFFGLVMVFLKEE